jgi:A/G-specific adenine glycosylase
MQFDIVGLKEWFNQEKRELPWRQTTDPYAVWISEVMLQQTQVSVVIPYYLHWMDRFPSIQALACSPLDEVIKAWEGLGYYARARHLHEGAQTLVNHFDGKLPDDEKQLKKIKGLGPYTIGAILSFAFHQKKAAVDGNVLRVLARYFAIEEDIAKPATIKKIGQMTQDLLPDEEPWIVNEALIELGATLCQRRAKCHECPIKGTCASYRLGWVEDLPIKSKGPKTEKLYREVAVIQCGDSFLVRKGEKGSVMSDLYEFPYFEGANEAPNPAMLQNKIEELFRMKISFCSSLAEVSHSFTRYHARLFPMLFMCENQPPMKGFAWMSREQLKKLAFSSGHRRIFHSL